MGVVARILLSILNEFNQFVDSILGKNPHGWTVTTDRAGLQPQKSTFVLNMILSEFLLMTGWAYLDFMTTFRLSSWKFRPVM